MLLLLKNHKIKRKDDKKITEKDLMNSAYIAIDTAVNPSEFSKNYVLVDPSRIPWFTKAHIKYQMLFLYDDHDEGLRNYEPIPPVDTEVETISDLINIMNCVDRLYIVNQMLSNDIYIDVNPYIIIGYLEVILYNENKKVYHRIYNNDEDFELSYGNEIKFPLKVLKTFKKIYNADIIIDLFQNNQFIYLHDDMTWNIDVIDRYSLIGVPLIGSRTISFLTDKEYLRIMNIRKMSITYTIVFVYNRKHREYISQMIEEEKYDELGTSNQDYLIVSQLDYGGKHGKPYNFYHLDIFSMIGFCIRMSNLVYHHIEGFDADTIDDGDGVETITCFDVEHGSWHKKEKNILFFMNESTLIPLDNILNLI